MAKIKVEKTSNYTVITNSIFRDRRLSAKALGLLCLMLSLPEDWDYTVEGLTMLLKDGRDSITSALKELEKLGYLIREQSKELNGRFSENIYIVRESPVIFSENPFTEKPLTVSPITEKPEQEKNNKESNKEENINSSIKENINIKENGTTSSSKKKDDDIVAAIKEVEAEELLSCYGEEEEALIESIRDWQDMRKSKKNPATAKAIKLNLSKACKLAESDVSKIVKIFEQSTMNGWQGIFALPENRQQKGNHSNEQPAFEMHTELLF